MAVHYVYNADNRLIRVEDELTGTVIAEYYYDPFGRRLWKDVAGTRTYFFYSDEGLIAEYDSSGSEIRSYGYQPDSTWTTDPLFLTQNGSYYFYQNDHLGTPQKLAAMNGRVVWSATYNAFGEALVDESSSVENNLRFPGQYYDEESGLHYNGFRYYHPQLGRYMQVDPSGFGGGDVNWYRYARNNPISSRDPLGLEITDQQFEEALKTIIEEYTDSATTTGKKNHLKGEAGEVVLERFLKKAGLTIVKGPVTTPGKRHNSDVVAYDPDSKKLYFFDNKVSQTRDVVSPSQVKNLTTNRTRSIEEAILLLEELDISHSLKDTIEKALRKAEDTPSKAYWMVANATHEEIANITCRISKGLARKGVRYVDILKEIPDLKLKSYGDAVIESRVKKLLKEAVEKSGKALPVIVGGGISALVNAPRIQAAYRDDMLYEEFITSRGRVPSYPGHATKRELAIIAGEEGGSELGAWAGGGLGGVLGWGPWGVAGGAFIGGVLGDTIGGISAARAFEEGYRLSEESKLRKQEEEIQLKSCAICYPNYPK